LNVSDLVAWGAVLSLPAAALLGWFLRGRSSGAFRVRMRPHFILGYAALALACVHLTLSMGDTGAANINGIWFAGFALAGLGVQTFVGASLQSPGSYRAPLRRWHRMLFWSVAALVLGHVFLNAPFFARS
jgi:hypothetical protein